jgi:hypothetical protein
MARRKSSEIVWGVVIKTEGDASRVIGETTQQESLDGEIAVSVMSDGIDEERGESAS